MGLETNKTGKPRLLIIVNVFHPDRGGGGAIFSDLCYGLASLNYDVTVRCAYPYYPEWRDKSGQNGLRVQAYEENGVHVERYGLYIPRNPHSLAQRLVYEASFLASLSRSWFYGGRFDLVMAYCPLVGAVAFAAVNKWFRRAPLWLNVQDLSADAAVASGISRGKTFNRLLSGVQSFFFNQADYWSSISPVMIRRLQAIRKRNQPVLYLPNWLNESMAREIATQGGKVGRLPQDVPNLLYASNIGAKQDLLKFCRMLHASSARFAFKIHGNGAEAPAVQKWVQECNDPRFSFGPFLEENQFAEALHKTDFFVITEKTGSGGSFIPCKMIAGIASGSPVLAVCDSDTPLGQEMQLARVGPRFSWDAMGDAAAILNSPESCCSEFAGWQANAVDRAEFYRRDAVIGRFDSAIQAVLNKSPLPSELELAE